MASRVTELPETNSKRGRTYDREVGRRKREEPLSRGYVCLDPGDGKGGEEEIPAKETEKGRREEVHGSSHQRVVLIESLRGVCSSLLI